MKVVELSHRSINWSGNWVPNMSRWFAALRTSIQITRGARQVLRGLATDSECGGGPLSKRKKAAVAQGPWHDKMRRTVQGYLLAGSRAI
jgi:hypothetical protein